MTDEQANMLNPDLKPDHLRELSAEELMTVRDGLVKALGEADSIEPIAGGEDNKDKLLNEIDLLTKALQTRQQDNSPS